MILAVLWLWSELHLYLTEDCKQDRGLLPAHKEAVGKEEKQAAYFNGHVSIHRSVVPMLLLSQHQCPDDIFKLPFATSGSPWMTDLLQAKFKEYAEIL